MMFQAKMKELCQEIHDSLGNGKINDCLLVDVEFKNESFIIKAFKCLPNFINCDYSSNLGTGVAILNPSFSQK